MAELEQTFRVPVIEAYGMTEASHQIATNPHPPAARKPGSVGLAFGTDVAIMDANGNGNLLAPGEIGEIVLRGPGVIVGLRKQSGSESQFVRQRMVPDGRQWKARSRRLPVHHRAYQGDHQSRRPENLAARNRRGPLYSSRRRAMRSRSRCRTIAWARTLQPRSCFGRDTRRRKSRSGITPRIVIADYKVPRRIVFLDELPKGPTGKLQRIGLAAQLGLDGVEHSNSSNRPNEFVAPSTPTERTLTTIWEQVLGVERIGVHDDFLALGGDSMLAALIIARIRDATDAPVSILAFFEHPTVAELGRGDRSRRRGPPRCERSDCRRLRPSAICRSRRRSAGSGFSPSSKITRPSNNRSQRVSNPRPARSQRCRTGAERDCRAPRHFADHLPESARASRAK